MLLRLLVVRIRIEEDEYFKVPELLPTFKSENEDPEAFVDDFNTVLECIEETEETKTLLWFKNRISVPSSNCKANLNPRKDSLHAYQRAFLKYFWSPSLQRLAIENFENAGLNLKSEISVSRQILNFYSKVKRVRFEPISDSKFKREIDHKLARSIRGDYIGNRDRPGELAVKVSEDCRFVSRHGRQKMRCVSDPYECGPPLDKVHGSSRWERRRRT